MLNIVSDEERDHLCWFSALKSPDKLKCWQESSSSFPSVYIKTFERGFVTLKYNVLMINESFLYCIIFFYFFIFLYHFYKLKKSFSYFFSFGFCVKCFNIFLLLLNILCLFIYSECSKNKLILIIRLSST